MSLIVQNTLIQNDVEMLQNCVAAWNRSDPEGTASFYHDQCDYKDPTVPGGVKSRSDLARYLKILFQKWPEQEWVEDSVMPHAVPGQYSVTYRFGFGNKAKGVHIKGVGIDYIEIEDGLIKKNWVYLNADRWVNWVNREGKQ